ncbi:MAG: peptidoglycan-binding protein, partial [Actinomycetota bacterium]|nr:peptidoglycan-binding protein [Actinomycetota bacterium]
MAVVGVALVAAGIAAPAAAQESPGVTLRAEPRVVAFGARTSFSGQISPASPDQAVNIIDEMGRVIATTLTDATGTYLVRTTLRANMTVRAQWVAALSEPVVVQVRPAVSTALREVRLFGRARVTGSVRPAHPGETVRVRLFRDGGFVRSQRVRLRDGRWFGTAFAIHKPGNYRVSATLRDADHLPGVGRSSPRATPLPSLGSGSENIYVRLLEKRLVALNYHLVGVNRRYDYRTADAVRAFNKVQGRARLGTVDVGTWRALARPHIPKPRADRGGFYI